MNIPRTVSGKWRVWVALCLLGLSGACRQDSHTRAPGAAPSERAPEAPAAPSGPAAEARYTLTAAKLDGFVRYQKAMNGIQDALAKELERLPARGDAGLPAAEVSRIMKILEGRSHAEAQARAEAGLSERETREIERMVVAVISRRSMGRGSNAGEILQQWEKLQDKIGPSSRASVDKLMVELRQEQEETAALAEERRQLGDANVDLILTREEELAKGYSAFVARQTR